MVLLAVAAPRNAPGTTFAFALCLCVVSVASWALPPAQNHLISGLDIPEPTVALSLNGSSSYLGLALGGALGGLALERGSITTLTLTGAAIELLALVIVVLAAALARQRRTAAG